MNDIVNKISLTGDKCMCELHLKQPEFPCNVCGSFTKNKESVLNRKCKKYLQK